MRETLRNFLSTGTFYFFPFGTCREQAVDLLGSTNNIIPRSRKDSRPAVLKYDRVEFYFNELDKLHGVMLQLVSEPVETGRLELDCSFVSERTTEHEITSELNKLNLNYKRQVNFDTTHITTETGVTFYIDGTLEKIGKFVD